MAGFHPPKGYSRTNRARMQRAVERLLLERLRAEAVGTPVPPLTESARLACQYLVAYKGSGDPGAVMIQANGKVKANGKAPPVKCHESPDWLSGAVAGKPTEADGSSGEGEGPAAPPGA